MVVKAASAMQLASNNFYVLEDCDRMQVCKPPSKEHQSYSKLLDVLRLCKEGTDPPAVWCERAEQAAALDGTGQVKHSETPKWHGYLLGCSDSRVKEVYKMACNLNVFVGSTGFWMQEPCIHTKWWIWAWVSVRSEHPQNAEIILS
jgi:hypothetical protein